MSFYYECECGNKINKLTTKSVVSDEELRDVLAFYDNTPIIECLMCGTKYKVKKPPLTHIIISFVLGFIVMMVINYFIDFSSIFQPFIYISLNLIIIAVTVFIILAY